MQSKGMRDSKGEYLSNVWVWPAGQLWDAMAINLRRDEGRWAASDEGESAARTIYLYSEHTDQLCKLKLAENCRDGKRSKCYEVKGDK